MLVGPGPLWVRRWRFLYDVPRAGVVLWQAGAVAALIAVGALGVLAGRAVPDLWPEVRGPERSAADVVGLVTCGWLVLLALLVGGRLCWALLRVARTTSERRERHRDLVDLLGTIDLTVPDPTSTDRTRSLGGLRILADQVPVAYSLPGLWNARVVISQGALSRLRPDEVTAVLAHERAHVRARHDLVLDTFAAVHRAFPLFIRSEIPWQEAQLLVEMLADDQARRRVGGLPLARALVALAGTSVPDVGLGAGAHGVTLRITRLAEQAATDRTLGGRRRRVLAIAVYALAAGLVVLPPALVVLTPVIVSALGTWLG